MKSSEKILKLISNVIETGILTSQDAKKELINNLKFKRDDIINNLKLVSREDFNILKKVILESEGIQNGRIIKTEIVIKSN